MEKYFEKVDIDEMAYTSQSLIQIEDVLIIALEMKYVV